MTLPAVKPLAAPRETSRAPGARGSLRSSAGNPTPADNTDPPAPLKSLVQPASPGLVGRGPGPAGGPWVPFWGAPRVGEAAPRRTQDERRALGVSRLLKQEPRSQIAGIASKALPPGRPRAKIGGRIGGRIAGQVAW